MLTHNFEIAVISYYSSKVLYPKGHVLVNLSWKNPSVSILEKMFKNSLCLDSFDFKVQESLA